MAEINELEEECVWGGDLINKPPSGVFLNASNLAYFSGVPGEIPRRYGENVQTPYRQWPGQESFYFLINIIMKQHYSSTCCIPNRTRFYNAIMSVLSFTSLFAYDFTKYASIYKTMKTSSGYHRKHLPPICKSNLMIKAWGTHRPDCALFFVLQIVTRM